MSGDPGRAVTPPDTDATGVRSVPDWLVRTAGWVGRLLVLGVALWLLALLVLRLTLLVVPLAVGLLIAGVFIPVVEWADRHRVPRWLSSLVVVLGLLGLLVAVLSLLGARVAEQLPRLRDQLGQAMDQVSRTLGVTLPTPSNLGGGGSGGSGGSGGALGSSLTEVLGVAATTFEVFVALFLALAFAFLFLKDGADMWGWLVRRLPPRFRDDVGTGGEAAWLTLHTYVRGLTIVAAFDAVAIGLGLLALGVPLVLTLATLQFVFSYVPTIGAIVAGAAAVAVALVSSGLVTAGLVLLLVLVVQQIGNSVIEPWVMGRGLRLHPAVVLAAVTAGALLWGIPGALLFVPLTAAVSAAARAVDARHRTGEAEPAPDGAA